MADKNKKGKVRKVLEIGGNSLGVTIPVEFVRKLKWRKNKKVLVELKEDEIVVKSWPDQHLPF